MQEKSKVPTRGRFEQIEQASWTDKQMKFNVFVDKNSSATFPCFELLFEFLIL